MFTAASRPSRTNLSSGDTVFLETVFVVGCVKEEVQVQHVGTRFGYQEPPLTFVLIRKDNFEGSQNRDETTAYPSFAEILSDSENMLVIIVMRNHNSFL